MIWLQHRFCRSPVQLVVSDDAVRAITAKERACNVMTWCRSKAKFSKGTWRTSNERAGQRSSARGLTNFSSEREPMLDGRGTPKWRSRNVNRLQDQKARFVGVENTC